MIVLGVFLGHWARGFSAVEEPGRLETARASSANPQVENATDAPESGPGSPQPDRPDLVELLRAQSVGQVLELLGKFLPAATGAECQSIAEHWGSALPGRPDLGNSPWKLLIVRWAELHPQKALQWVDGMQPQSKRHIQALRELVLTVWADQNLAGALARAEQDPDRCLSGVIDLVVERNFEAAVALFERFPGNVEVAGAVLAKLAEEDPEEAFARAKTLDRMDRLDVMKKVLGAQAETDPRGALEQAYQLEALGERSEAVGNLITVLAGRDLSLAETLVSELPFGAVRKEAFKRLIWQHQSRDPKAALTWAKGLPDGPERQTALARTLESLVDREEDDFDVLSAIDELGWKYAQLNSLEDHVNIRMAGSGYSNLEKKGTDFRFLAVPAITRLARTDPHAALSYLGKLPEGGLYKARESAAIGVFSEWMKRDPEEAFSSLLQLPGNQLMNEVTRSLVESSRTEESQRFFMDHIKTIEDPEIGSDLAGRLASRLAGTDPQEALIWIENLPVGQQEAARLAAIKRFTSTDPTMAQEQVLFLTPGGKERQDQVARISGVLASQDLNEATQWLDSLEPEDRTPNAFASIVRGRPWNDNNETEAWVANLSPGPHRDAAAAQLATRSYQSLRGDFTAAREWARFIEDETVRNGQLQEIYESWLRKDPVQAKAFLREAPLPNATKNQLLDR
ncbi:MAG: hypothetical protein AAF514_13215 [Verrucomicrobiota bacterium]